MERRVLGSTGEKLSIVGFGGIVVSGMEQGDADAVVAEAVERGVNYFDVAPTYGDAEERLGPALEPHRHGVFLACKTACRDRAGAEEELQRSLQRLRTDHFDLYQLHGVPNVEEARKILAPGGALEAFVAARARGLVRFLGFSAHDPEAALVLMDAFDFDSVLFPLNVTCFTKAGFGPQVLARAQEKGMGRLALKAMAREPWPEGAERTYRKCWYRPFSDPAEAELGLRFTLSLPITAAIPPGEAPLFRLALDIADRFTPLTDEEQAQARAFAAGLKPIFGA